MITQAPRGTYDLYGEQMTDWQRVESEIAGLMQAFHYSEIRTPVFEHTELFQRGVGDTTDIVQKEMYTFEDKGGRSITLKPEGTAGAARAYLEHKLYADPQPTKLYYVTPCFRYEKPQAGRNRQFTQFGVELYGASSPVADVEVISIGYELLRRLGINNVMLHINSLGCENCRARYNNELKAYFGERREQLCDTCRDRLERNPLRILDCKNPECREIVAGAPSILDALDDECRAHFEEVKRLLEALGIPYVVDPGIVRGLDYYTRTVFEFVCTEIGAQGTVCAGGRYDHLIEELGGDAVPAVGFGAGIERLLLAMKASGRPSAEPCALSLFVGHYGAAAEAEAAALTYRLRQENIPAECDLLGRSVKAQMKYANKKGARFTMILGDTELETGSAVLKNMENGDNTSVFFRDISDWKGLITG
ncbi:MAG: histidine--tRNA ligase [Firmicutes bacterium]|nr:histidine--tRNA ligase [Bacillota bacterium]